MFGGDAQRSRVRRRADGRDIVVRGVGDAPEVQVVALLRRGIVIFLEAGELPEQCEHSCNKQHVRLFQARAPNAPCLSILAPNLVRTG